MNQLIAAIIIIITIVTLSHYSHPRVACNENYQRTAEHESTSLKLESF